MHQNAVTCRGFRGEGEGGSGVQILGGASGVLAARHIGRVAAQGQLGQEDHLGAELGGPLADGIGQLVAQPLCVVVPVVLHDADP